MNYHKKIISFGFRRTHDVVLVRYQDWPNNEYVMDMKKYVDMMSKNDTVDLYLGKVKTFTRITNRYPYDITHKILCYQYKVTSNMTFYLIVDRGEYCFIVDEGNPISVIKIGVLSESFLKDIINSLNMTIKREVLIRNLVK